MYILSTITNKDQMANDLFFTLNAEELNRTERVEVWASNFNDAGDDFCEARFFEPNSAKPYKTQKVNGY